MAMDEKRDAPDPKGAELRMQRLQHICKSIENQAFFGGLVSERAEDISALRQAFRLQGLWIINGEDILKSGSVDYAREIENFLSLKSQYADLRLLKMKRSKDFYYVLDVGPRKLAFSTFMEFTNNDLYLLVREAFRIQGFLKEGPSRTRKKSKAFLETNNKHKV